MIKETLKATNRCVMCGLCLPHCPTYHKSRNEADSPRGRVSLMKALNDECLPVSAALVNHLDGCLSCRACEAVCPANVPYGDLIDSARQVLFATRGWRPRSAMTITTLLISHRWVRKLIGILIRLYQQSGLQKLLRASGLLGIFGIRRYEAFVGSISHYAIPFKRGPVLGTHENVALFTGCFAEIFDRDTLTASLRMLRHLGYNVWVPKHQGCCGALHQHNGQPDKAMSFTKQNLVAFNHPQLDTVISTATGCGAQLLEYANHIPNNQADQFSKLHTDISAFLARNNHMERLTFKPLGTRVVVHAPCSLTHILRQSDQVIRILAQIPEIELIDLPDNARCCGAAGSYMLTQPDMSDALLQDKLEWIRQLNPSILVTSNIGCRLHIQAGLQRRRYSVEVIHPVTLLERQLIKN